MAEGAALALTPPRPTLLVIDVQRAFDDPRWAHRNNPGAESRLEELLAAWRNAEAPVIHVRHRSTEPDGLFKDDGFEFKDEAAPAHGEPVVEKAVNNAFVGTDLEQRLRAAGAETVVVAGLTTDHCCSTTARMASDLGFEVWFVDDATATHARELPDGRRFDAETMHESALASLSEEFAEIVDTAEAVRRVAR
jgi:nicotinamidase-related amidase